MGKRYISIWFRHLLTDRLTRQQPELKDTPFVLATKQRGRMVITAANANAQKKSIDVGMVVADCRAIQPDLKIINAEPGQEIKLLTALAEWCLRYSPAVAIDPPNGLIIDISGCAHLWGGERPYLKEILDRFKKFGYDTRAAIADTIGTAWAIARYGKITAIIEPANQVEAILQLPPAALRLEMAILSKLEKLGLYQISNFIHMPRNALRRRFGQDLLNRLDQATGQGMEIIQPVHPIEPYQERLPSMEPIRTATGIEIALKRLLDLLCERLTKEGLGLRKGIFKGYRIDGEVEQIEIGTNQASNHAGHLLGLFKLKIETIRPALGIELFILEAPTVEEVLIEQEALWKISRAGDQTAIAQLLDRLAGKVGMGAIRRYLPDEHYWPERSIKTAVSLQEQPAINWRTELRRPLHLLCKPEEIDVSVPLPDYPPLLFRHKGMLHQVIKADGPERIEQEWWLEQGLHRDYYQVEDEHGVRYWLFRSGHYNDEDTKWYIHGFFA